MSSFKLPSFSFSGGSSKQDDQNGEEPEREGRKSRSIFSSLTGHSSSHSNGSSASLRSPSPYAGRQRYKDGKDKDSSKHRHRPWKRHSRKESHSDIEYSGATSSANVSEAESDGEGALSRLASNSSTNTASSSNTAANTSGLAPLSSSTSSSTAASTAPSNTVSFADSPPKSARPARTRFTPASSGPQAGRGAPRNAYYDSDEENAGDQEHSDNDDDDDDENDAQTPTAATATVAPATADSSKATVSPESVRSASSAASSATSPKIRGIRTIDPLSDSDYEDPSHEEYSHTSDTDDGDEYYSNDDDDDMDPTVLANTEANAGSLTAAELLSSKPALLAGYGDDDPDAYYYNGEEDGPLENWPNLVKSPASPFAPLASTTSRPAAVSRNAGTSLGAASSTLSSGNNNPPGTTRNGRGRGGTIKSEIPLVASRPVYERNRCTITLTHGDPDAYVQEPGNLSLLESGKSLSHVSAAKSGAKNTVSSNRTADGARKKRKGKTYVVASDLSEESYYAIEWAIGTVLRSGDELLFVTVMETDSKLDPEDGHAHDKTLKIRSQQERQTRTMQLSREATALLERTRLHVRVKCQAIHAKNARHMLIDLIDYFAPTLVIIGSRGLSRLKGIILGSVSHYLIQKSSAPVMVTRRRLKPLRRPPRPISDLQRQPRVGGLANATIDVESHAGMVHQSHAGSDNEDGDVDAHRLHKDADTGGETETDEPVRAPGKA